MIRCCICIAYLALVKKRKCMQTCAGFEPGTCILRHNILKGTGQRADWLYEPALWASGAVLVPTQTLPQQHVVGGWASCEAQVKAKAPYKPPPAHWSTCLLCQHVQETEQALSTLLDMANQDPNNVPVLLAMATGFMMLKQVRAGARAFCVPVLLSSPAVCSAFMQQNICGFVIFTQSGSENGIDDVKYLASHPPPIAGLGMGKWTRWNASISTQVGPSGT